MVPPALSSAPPPAETRRKDALLVRIRAAYARGRQAYGAPRIHQELVRRGGGDQVAADLRRPSLRRRPSTRLGGCSERSAHRRCT